jgi:hypothetical protein
MSAGNDRGLLVLCQNADAIILIEQGSTGEPMTAGFGMIVKNIARCFFIS